MIVTKITYRRLINLGNYENITVEMTAEIDGEDAVPPSFETLRQEVHDAIRAQLATMPDVYRSSWPDLFPPAETAP